MKYDKKVLINNWTSKIAISYKEIFSIDKKNNKNNG